MQKTAFYTLGCKANQYQTEVIKSRVMGHESRVVNFNSEADIYIVNTCTVTEDADRKSRQAIRRALRQNPKAKIIVTGCYARLNKEEISALFPQVECLDTSSIVRLDRARRGLRPSSIVPRVRANLMIQDGCEHFCSYCVVPYARGKIQSKPIDDVIAEARQLVGAGAREIVLTGINLGTYGKNVAANFSSPLSSVIQELSKIENLHRVRLSSLEPMYLTKELIDKVAETPKVCHHLHIPLQSGEDTILKAMNRNYSRDEYHELIDYIRSRIPDCGITTDVIVGFPGEGEKEFRNTFDLINQIKFSRLHIFTYSKRKETVAADFPNQVDAETKRHRSKVLHELRNKYMAEFASQYLNKEVEILVEQKGEGLTSNYIRCFFADTADSSGQIKKIHINKITAVGEIRE